MAEWQFVCPKCGSTNYEVEEDRLAYLGMGKYSFVFHCRCGKMIIGEDTIREEMDRQRSTFERAAEIEQAATAHQEAEFRRKTEEASQLAQAAKNLRKRVQGTTRRGTVEVSCMICGKQAWRRPSDVKRYKNFFCGNEHAQQYKRQSAEASEIAMITLPRAVRTENGSMNVACAICGKEVHRKPSEIRANKSGQFYCSPEHSRQATHKQRIKAMERNRGDARRDTMQKIAVDLAIPFEVVSRVIRSWESSWMAPERASSVSA